MEFKEGGTQMEIQFPANPDHGVQLELNLDDPKVARKVERVQKSIHAVLQWCHCGECDNDCGCVVKKE